MDTIAGQWALVTGASSGLGRELARVLARRKMHLVIAARRQEELEKLAAELRAGYGVQVVVECIDLGASGAAEDLSGRLAARGIEIEVLINNAAFGLSGDFLQQDAARLRDMLQLDIVSVVELTQALGRQMAARGHGHVLLVASLAAYQPTPLLAAYGAAKQFVLAFGVALHVELAKKVGVTVVSPGLMDTEFFEVSGYRPKASLKATMVPPSQVAESAVKAMFKGRSSLVVGRLNRLAAFSNRFTSRLLQAKLSYRMAKD